MKAKRLIAILLAGIMVLALFGCSKEAEIIETTTTTTTTTTEAPPLNPLTGEEGYSKSALTTRPVAIVVENLSPARPQWGIKSPDIIVEGEVEGGISRMLWIYADYTTVPKKVGPIRSARPSYVQFSELFDAIYIHWGGSHSKGEYTGGYETIKKDKVNDIDGMHGGELFGRDTTRSVSSEHRGILHGDKIVSTIEKKGYRTELNTAKFPAFVFNSSVENAGTSPASTLKVKFSDRTDTRKFTYNAEDKTYHTNDWKTDVKFENVVALQTPSKYITTPYKGGSTTYLNYTILNTEGTGYYASNGTVTEIKWSTTSGTLVLSTIDGKRLPLNVGNSYIGLVSNNHNGSVSYE